MVDEHAGPACDGRGSRGVRDPCGSRRPPTDRGDSAWLLAHRRRGYGPGLAGSRLRAAGGCTARGRGGRGLHGAMEGGVRQGDAPDCGDGCRAAAGGRSFRTGRWCVSLRVRQLASVRGDARAAEVDRAGAARLRGGLRGQCGMVRGPRGGQVGVACAPAGSGARGDRAHSGLGARREYLHQPLSRGLVAGERTHGLRRRAGAVPAVARLSAVRLLR